MYTLLPPAPAFSSHPPPSLVLPPRFPSDPPKGKGNRISEASGLVATSEVQLPDISKRYRESCLNLADDPPVEQCEGRAKSMIRMMSHRAGSPKSKGSIKSRLGVAAAAAAAVAAADGGGADGSPRAAERGRLATSQSLSLRERDSGTVTEASMV